MDWKNFASIQNELKITDSLDVRFLKLKLKEFERKKLIERKEISEETHYKCTNNDLLDKTEIININSPKVILKKKEEKPLISKKKDINHTETSKNSAQHNVSDGEKTQELAKNKLPYCFECGINFKSKSELKQHQKANDHLFMKEFIALLQRHYSNTDLHKESISVIQNLKLKRQKTKISSLHRIFIKKIKETGNEEANLDLHKLLVKYYPKYLEMLGDIYVECEDYTNAIIVYKKAMSFTRNKSIIQSKLAPLHFKMGDQENVIALIKKIIPSGSYMSQVRLDLQIKRDWKRLKSGLISQNEKTPNIPKEILNEKLKMFEQCEMQYLFWYLNCPTTQNEVSILNRFMRSVNAKFIHEIDSVIHYRTFDKKNDTSIHIKAIRKDWGFAINIHRDLFKHQHTIFDKNCLKFLSKLYIFLAKKKGGHRFILPRQEKNFQSYLGRRFTKNMKFKH